MLSRRTMLKSAAGAFGARGLRIAPGRPLTPLGIVIHSYAIRSVAEKDTFARPAAFLEHCGKLGAAGVQVSIGALGDNDARGLGALAGERGMYLEGIVRLPRERSDEARFLAEVRAAHLAGATVLRTVLLNGRRYEAFDSKAAFSQFLDAAIVSLARAARIVEESGTSIRIAVENHKDLRAEQLVSVLKRIGGDRVGVCLDTGNSIALLEDPVEVVEHLAPWTLTTHFKDMAVDEYADGILLSEVPLGRGFLDLGRMIATVRRARTDTRFNLEMITRDPLKVPCLTERYWATLDDLPAAELARSLAMARSHREGRPLAKLSGEPLDAQLRIEEQNVAISMQYAMDVL